MKEEGATSFDKSYENLIGSQTDEWGTFRLKAYVDISIFGEGCSTRRRGISPRKVVDLIDDLQP